MLETLSERLQATFGRLGSRGRITEDDLDTALREVRIALLEADVNFRVVGAGGGPGAGRPASAVR